MSRQQFLLLEIYSEFYNLVNNFKFFNKVSPLKLIYECL